MSTASKVREEKERHPERFCDVPRCLYRTLHRDNTWSECPKHIHREGGPPYDAATATGMYDHDDSN